MFHEEEDDEDKQEAAPAAEHVVEDNEMHQQIKLIAKIQQRDVRNEDVSQLILL